jgi:plastocyanin
MSVKRRTQHVRRAGALALALGLALLAAGRPASTAPARAAATAVVSGTVTAKGLKNSGNIVVRLDAPGLRVKPPLAPVRMDQRAFQFIPHVLPVVVGATVRFLNNDPEPHNVYSPEGRYNLGTWPPGETRDQKFDRPGAYTQLCRVHPDMLAFIVVVETPFFTVTDEAGRFEIRGVPPGSYTLVAWSEKLDEVSQPVSVVAGKAVTADVVMER